MGLFIFWCIMFVIVLIHEFGHLIVAKKLGVRVNTYSIGFGPRIFGVKYYKGKWAYKFFNFKSNNEWLWFRKDVTEYRISPVPFGGFCDIAGETSSSGKEYELASKTFFKKCAIVWAGVLLNIVTGIMAIVGIFIVKYGITNFADSLSSFCMSIFPVFSTSTNYKIVPASEINIMMGTLSFEQIIFTFGLFSIFMAIINMLPFPALDGSYPILWILESRFGKLGKRILKYIWFSGFVFLMVLQVVIFYFWIWG